MRGVHRQYFVLVLSLLFVVPRVARPQVVSVSEDAEVPFTVTTVVGLAVTAVVAVVLTVRKVDEYAQTNAQSIRLTLARGSGSFASDIAAHVGLREADVPRVGALLRGARRELDALLRRDTPDRGSVLFAAVEDILRRDPDIGPRMSPMTRR